MNSLKSAFSDRIKLCRESAAADLFPTSRRILHAVKCTLCSIFISLLSLFIFAPQSTAQHFTIENFHSEIAIHKDGVVEIAETIEVIFDRPKHGIFREIPYKYENELGKTISMPLDVIGVTDAKGEKIKSKVSHTGNIVNIRIGDADVYVEGRQTYVIKYKVERALLYFDDHDELYWNVTGNNWPTPIERASANITLASERESSKILTGCYTGYYGSRNSACQTETSGNSASFVTTAPLDVGEGLTVAFGWDKNIVTYPTEMDNLLYSLNLGENWVFIIPPLVFFFLFRRWQKYGRDPKVREALVVRYEPPQTDGRLLTPAEVGALVDERLDQRDIAAAIVGLAEKGYLKIVEKKNEGMLGLFQNLDYSLLRLKQSDSALSPFERMLFESLFTEERGSTQVSDLSKRFYKHLPRLRTTLFDELKARKFFLRTPENIRNRYVGYGIAVMLLGLFLAVALTPDSPTKSIVVVVLSGLCFIFFAPAMPVKTAAGALACMDVKGFQEFMTKADKDRLERMGPETFYKYLPYAIALDVVDTWAHAFEGLFKQASPPSWYVPYGGFHAFTPIGFTKSLNAATSSLATAAFSAPRGSGTSGGGGGFSGGGGGGGGGGSW